MQVRPLDYQILERKRLILWFRTKRLDSYLLGYSYLRLFIHCRDSKNEEKSATQRTKNVMQCVNLQNMAGMAGNKVLCNIFPWIASNRVAVWHFSVQGFQSNHVNIQVTDTKWTDYWTNVFGWVLTLLGIIFLRYCCRQEGVSSSVGDPDPEPHPQDSHVFRPPGSGSGSISQKYGSGSG